MPGGSKKLKAPRHFTTKQWTSDETERDMVSRISRARIVQGTLGITLEEGLSKIRSFVFPRINFGALQPQVVFFKWFPNTE